MSTDDRDLRLSLSTDDAVVEPVCLDRVTRRGVARLAFRTEGDGLGPCAVIVRGPDGKIVIERICRELPEGSVGALAVPVATQGDYEIVVRPLHVAHRGPTTDPWELGRDMRAGVQRANRLSRAILRAA